MGTATQAQEQRVYNGGKIWTQKPEPENSVRSRAPNDANNQTAMNSCQLMIGSISVAVRNSTGQSWVTSPAKELQESGNTEIKIKGVQNVLNHSYVKLHRTRHETRGQLADENKSQTLEEDLTSARGDDQTLTAESSHQSCEGTNDCNVQVEGNGKLRPFSIDAATDFLAQRWKEAVSGDHVELVVTSELEPRLVQDDYQSSDSITHANKFRTKPKSMKIKYIPKQRSVF